MKFKVGDRVVGVGFVDDLNIDEQHGIIISETGYDFLIKFDERFSDNLHNEDNRCWFAYSSNLKFEESEEKMKRRKEASLRNIDKDPFQEEIWEHMKRFKDYGKI